MQISIIYQMVYFAMILYMFLNVCIFLQVKPTPEKGAHTLHGHSIVPVLEKIKEVKEDFTIPLGTINKENIATLTVSELSHYFTYLTGEKLSHILRLCGKDNHMLNRRIGLNIVVDHVKSVVRAQYI